MSRLLNADPGDYIQLEQGTFDFERNEVHLRTAYDDPPGMSFHNDYGNSLGKLSGKHNGHEHVLLQFKRNAKGGECYLGVLDIATYDALVAQGDQQALDHAMIEAINVQPDGIEFRVPVKFSAGMVTVQTAQYPTGNYDGAEFVGSEGHFRYARQADHHDVLYNAAGVAIWVSDGGVNGTWLA